MKTAQIKTNPVKKFMEQVNRPATHKDKHYDSKKYACRKFNQRNHKEY